MRTASIAVLREIGVETGGSNVQFAVNPADGRMVIIEMNPRVSRSSALASKATGFPIAKIAAKLAVGYTLDELKNDITQRDAGLVRTDHRLCRHQDPALCLREIPRAPIRLLTTSMKSVGEAMAIGRTFAESLQKALRSLETGLTGLDEIDLPDDQDAIRAALASATPDRLRIAAQAMRYGFPARRHRRDHQIRSVVPGRDRSDPGGRSRASRATGCRKTPKALRRLKSMGFSDARLAKLAQLERRRRCAQARHAAGVRPVFKRIDTCAAEFAAHDAVHVFDLRNAGRRRGRMRKPSHRQEEDHHPGRRSQPHRPGHRIRLLLLPRGLLAVRARLRDHHGQLQSGNRLDRLRHLRPALFRTADRGRRARDRGDGAVERHARRRDRAVRRPDAAQARQQAASMRACRSWAPAPTRSTSPKTASASRCC